MKTSQRQNGIIGEMIGSEQTGRTKKTSCDVIMENRSHKIEIPSAYEKNRRQNRKASARTWRAYSGTATAWPLASSASCCWIFGPSGCRRAVGSAGCWVAVGSICRWGGGGGSATSSTSEPLSEYSMKYLLLEGWGGCRWRFFVEPGCDATNSFLARLALKREEVVDGETERRTSTSSHTSSGWPCRSY